MYVLVSLPKRLFCWVDRILRDCDQMLQLSLTDQERLSYMFFFTLSPSSAGRNQFGKGTEYVQNKLPGTRGRSSWGHWKWRASPLGSPQWMASLPRSPQWRASPPGRSPRWRAPPAPWPPSCPTSPWSPATAAYMAWLAPIEEYTHAANKGQTGWLSLKLVLISKPAISDRQGRVRIQYLGGCVPTLFLFSSSWHQSHHSLPHSPLAKHTDQHLILLFVDCQHVMIAHLRNHLSSSFSQSNQEKPILGQNVDRPKLPPRVPNPSCCCCPSPTSSRDPPPVSEIHTMTSHNHWCWIWVPLGNVKQGSFKADHLDFLDTGYYSFSG